MNQVHYCSYVLIKLQIQYGWLKEHRLFYEYLSDITIGK